MIAALTGALVMPTAPALAATSSTGKTSTSYVLEAHRKVQHTRYADYWKQWIWTGRYRIAQLTWTGVWALKNAWDDGGPGRGFAASLCGVVGLWNGYGALGCSLYSASSEWYWASLINKAVRRKWCIKFHTRLYGFGTGPSWESYVRCRR